MTEQRTATADHFDDYAFGEDADRARFRRRLMDAVSWDDEHRVIDKEIERRRHFGTGSSQDVRSEVRLVRTEKANRDRYLHRSTSREVIALQEQKRESRVIETIRKSEAKKRAAPWEGFGNG